MSDTRVEILDDESNAPVSRPAVEKNSERKSIVLRTLHRLGIGGKWAYITLAVVLVLGVGFIVYNVLIASKADRAESPRTYTELYELEN